MFAAAQGSSPSDFAFIEDVFSTWLYTGNGSTQTINNGIDLAGKGGLVWVKRRDADNHRLVDTARGVNWALQSNTTSGQDNSFQSVTAFNSNGFTVGSGSAVNAGASPIASWTFREQPKFFDIVTYTGNGANRTIAHNLGSVPGCIIVKRTDTSADWQVYHRSLANTQYMVLNSTAAVATGATRWNSTTPTATEFSLGTDATVNANGGTYVAYLFAHDAGGFGATGADNVISCGSFTTNADGVATVNLGYEPQWVLIKRVNGTENWTIFDNMRGWSSSQAQLFPDNSNAEGVGGPLEILRATGFATAAFSFSSNATVIYIAIRRGPMRTPTSGTSVFSPIAYNSVAGTVNTTGFPIDAAIQRVIGATDNTAVVDRLRGASSTSTDSGQIVRTNLTVAESSANVSRNWNNIGFETAAAFAGFSSIAWNFRRAPGFFDVVCYTGNGVSPQILNHNLGVFPQLVIVKSRSSSTNWPAVYVSDQDFTFSALLGLNSTSAAPFSAAGGQAYGNDATTFVAGNYLGNFTATNASGVNYVAYLFASCPGVSKVGTYTGTGNTQVINCGFAAGARFVLIKRTDSTGDWYVWDSARGIVAGNDPYLRLNSNAAEVTNTDWVDTAASGFELSNAAGNLVNINGASYIFLAIA